LQNVGKKKNLVEVFFNITKDNDYEKMISSIPEITGRQTFGFISAEFDPKEISNIYPNTPEAVIGDRFSIAGKLVETEDPKTIEITLNYGVGATITISQKYQLNTNDFSIGNVVTRYWAQKKIDELQLYVDIGDNKKEIVAVGKQFSIVTSLTSLIVLETLDQYLKHKICPPTELVELFEPYMKEIQLIEEKERNKQEKKLLAVLDLWKRRVAWWNTNYFENEEYVGDMLHHLEIEKELNLNPSDPINPIFWKETEDLKLRKLAEKETNKRLMERLEKERIKRELENEKHRMIEEKKRLKMEDEKMKKNFFSNWNN